MAVFLAGVGNAELFKKVNNTEYLFASAKTLTESSITIGVSEEDIRAGMGAKLYGKYFHTSTFDLKLTDAMFRLEYLAASVGSEIDFGGQVFKVEEIKAAESKLTISGTPVPMTSGGKTFIYIKKPEDEYFTTYEYAEGNIKDMSGAVATFDNGAVYCVKYLFDNDNARTLTVKANFIPDTLRLYLSCNLYSGDDKNPSTGTKIGSITIMVPRFMLKGNQELSMSMTGAATTALEGSALAADAEGCEGEGIYAKIIEVIDGITWKDKIKDIIVDNATEETDGTIDDVIEVYALIDGMAPKKLVANRDFTLSAEGLTINGASVSGTIAESKVVNVQGTGMYAGKTKTKTYTVAG